MDDDFTPQPLIVLHICGCDLKVMIDICLIGLKQRI